MPFSVRVKNFQSLKDVKIEVEGLTVVTGTNNAGKSALVRALHGAFSNTRGSDFVRHGESSSSVEVLFKDGHSVLWEKGPKTNRYVVDGQVLDRAERGPPTDVQNLGVRAIQAGGMDLWPQVARQLDGVVFLFDQQGHVMAEAVSDAERVTVLTKALRLSESESRQTNSEVKIRKRDLEEIRAREAIFVGLGPLQEEFKILRAREDACRAREASLEKWKGVLERWQHCKKEIRLLADVDRVSSLLPRPEAVGAIPSKLKSIDSLKNLQASYQAKKVQAQRWHGVSFSEVADAAEDIKGGLEKVRQRHQTLISLREIHQKIKDSERVAESIRKDEGNLLKTIQEVHEALERLVQAGERCPTCSQEIKGLP